eukprot:TRINITY_DN25536_c0_g1_i1.p1 TRINITY_DN25536_c0_g1~~TRINITY_DN25536_c0_g1_i1.p1  ORF type:complete len:643 (-),score=164.91 TRINITY_DN25536_c0_g1_i1:153-1868(-)
MTAPPKLTAPHPDDAVNEGGFALKDVDSFYSERQPPSLSAERERLKEMLREMRTKKVTKSVHRAYHDTGFFQYVAKNPYFENGTLAVIVVNSIWLAVDADYNKAAILLDAQLHFQVMEHFFCTVFTIEWVVRLCAYRQKWYALTDLWFVFDSLLVFFMILETWVMTAVMASMDVSGGGMGNTSVLRLVRLLRLLRMARMVRLLRSMPELLILVRGMAAATRSVCYSLCLLIVLMYIFGIIFVNMMKDTEAGVEFFATVPGSMNSLLTFGVFWDGIGDILGSLSMEGSLYYFTFLIFVMLAALMVMNLLIGVLCEVVSGVSATEKDAIMVDCVKDILSKHMSAIDENNDGMISKDEFLSMMDSPVLVHALNNINLDVVGLLDLVDDIFIDGCDISIEDFMDYIGQFRGSHASILKEVTDIKRILLVLHRDVGGRSPGKLLGRQVSSPRAALGREREPRKKVATKSRLELEHPHAVVHEEEEVCQLVRVAEPTPVWAAPPQQLPPLRATSPERLPNSAPPPSMGQEQQLEKLTRAVHDLHAGLTRSVDALQLRIARLERAISVDDAAEGSSTC